APDPAEHPPLAATRAGRCVPPGDALLPRLLRLQRGARHRRRPGRGEHGVRQRARDHLARADPRVLRGAEHPGVGLWLGLHRRRRVVAVPQRPDEHHARRPLLHLHVAQPELLLRAQHDARVDGDRARRLHRLPDRAAALLPRVGLLRQRAGLRRRVGRQLGQRAVQPLRGGALDARRVRADDRVVAGQARHQPGSEGPLVGISRARDVRHRGHGQPLPHGRRPRRPHRRGRRARRARAGTHQARGLALRAPKSRDHV
ncbi:MAG: FIG00761799: membrane protein, partial [uncultured Solirubrobacteraceae bacterium]